MESVYPKRRFIYLLVGWLLLSLFFLIMPGKTHAQAVVAYPMAIGMDSASTGGQSFKVFSYAYPTLTALNTCPPDLKSPGFSATGGSIAFNPVDQKVYYIETTSGNNSIIFSWIPGACPTNQPADYTFTNAFIVGLDFNPVTGIGYQIEFVGTSAPFDVYLRQVTSFSPLTAGAAQQIFLPAGKKIYQQAGDVVITPTGQMYFAFDNKLFSLDYSTYGPGTLNATYIDTLKMTTGGTVVGLAYSDGRLIASANSLSNSKPTKTMYDEIDMSTNPVTLRRINMPVGSTASKRFSALDMATLITGIGAAKKVNSVITTGLNTYRVTYDIKVKNYGNANLASVQVTDDVKSVFGASIFVNASVAAVGALPTGLTINSSFNGSTNTNIFTTGGTMKATPQDSARVRVTVNLNNPDLAHTYLNSAVATAKGANSHFNINVKDSSDDQLGLNPDANRNDVPDDLGEGTPTPLVIASMIGILSTHNVDFNAQLNNKQVDVSWNMVNNDEPVQMNVERSTDGTSFTGYKTLSGGVSPDLKHYGWTDFSPQEGANYYRIQFVKLSGEVYYSETIKVIYHAKAPAQLLVSPVPFSQSINFSLELEQNGKIYYRLVDFNGRQISAGERLGVKGQNSFNVDNLAGFASGTYILQVQTDTDVYKKVILKSK